MSNPAIAQRQLPGIIPSTEAVFVSAPLQPVAVLVRRAAAIALDGLMLLGVILSIPFVILAVGTPVALALRLVLWIGRLL